MSTLSAITRLQGAGRMVTRTLVMANSQTGELRKVTVSGRSMTERLREARDITGPDFYCNQAVRGRSEIDAIPMWGE